MARWVGAWVGGLVGAWFFSSHRHINTHTHTHTHTHQGEFEFKLVWPKKATNKNYNTWRQSTNPVSDMYTHASIYIYIRTH